jgi:cytoskeletal protein RodZ
MTATNIIVISCFVLIVVAFFVAGLIQVMKAVLTRFSKNTPSVADLSTGESLSETASDDYAIAAAIVIAKQTV